MKQTVLDKRTRRELLQEMKLRAASYTPEWRCSGDPSDPGTAIMEVFADMYSHTLDRFNALPEKYYVEFLRMLGVTEPDAESAHGYVRFDIHEVAEKAVEIPEHTLLSAPAANGGDNVIYETETRIEATPALLTDIFYCDPKNSLLQKMDPKKTGQPLFGPLPGENLSSHILYFSNNEVLSGEGSFSVQIELKEKDSYKNPELLEKIADPEKTAWSWFDGENWVPFGSREVQGSRLCLRKQAGEGFGEDPEGRRMIRCEFFDAEGEIFLDEARISSVPDRDVPVTEIAYGDLPLANGEGYCFGQTPGIYDLLYLKNDEVFCKRGALVQLNLQIKTEIVDHTDPEAAYDWTKNVIRKDDTRLKGADDAVIRRVVWEYFNGEGWAALKTAGDSNPFLPQDREKNCCLKFQLPADIQPVLVNADEGYYIRARIAEIDNMLSQNPRWLLPYLKKAGCSWQYAEGKRCSYVAALNDGNRTEIDQAEEVRELCLRAIYPTTQTGRALYFCFDRSPMALPLTMFFRFPDSGRLPGKLVAESLSEDGFHVVRMTDETDNFKRSGIVRLYLTREMAQKQLFGKKGYWLRFSCDGQETESGLLPRLGAIHVNVTAFRQQQQAEEQVFNTENYDKNKTVQLLNIPVQDAEVWVDETGRLSKEELEQLKEVPGTVSEPEENGRTLQLIRWNRVPDLRLSGGKDRAYEMDAESGRIHFGDNIHGMIPPEGAETIRVSYAYGGGTAGNQPAGAVSELIASIPMVDAVTNVTAACGGTESGSEEWLCRTGALNLRHRDRLLGTWDYEAFIREHFPRVYNVKCFSGRDRDGVRRPGHVTVVFYCSEATDLADTEDMAEKIRFALESRCDCTMAASGRLHVIPAREVCVNVEARVRLENLNRTADTQQKLMEEITALIDRVWRKRGIGERIQTEELYQLIAQTENVASVRNLLVQGSWMENGAEKVCNLEEKQEFLYSTVHSGLHMIRVQ